MGDIKWWLGKYPFLRIKDNRVYPWLTIDADDEYWFDDIPEGWVKSFGAQMCDELMEALGEYVDDFIIAQVKEKYGSLRAHWYWKDHNDDEAHKDIADKIYKILHKYEDISFHTCVTCGKPSTKFTHGWVTPVCESCYDKKYNGQR